MGDMEFFLELKLEFEPVGSGGSFGEFKTEEGICELKGTDCWRASLPFGIGDLLRDLE